MDFFDRQDRARRKTGLLLLLFALAVVLIVAAVCYLLVFLGGTTGLGPVEMLTNLAWVGAEADFLIKVGLATTAFIGLASLWRLHQLRAGGDAVARRLGGRLVTHLDEGIAEKRLLNVVEEMAIASGVPTPRVYVLDGETGINAFAAGFSPADAVIGVTRGCLEALDRDELQGVIAHEFSHILNGDMRLNMQLIGVVFGIQVIGMTGQRMVLPDTRFLTQDTTRDVLFPEDKPARERALTGGADPGWIFTRRITSRGTGSLFLLVIGLALLVIGYLGVLLARIIKAAVSREREYLADASAVQFTRNPEGILGALKKIAGFAEHSYLRTPRAEEVSHMLLGARRAAGPGLLASHPPILKRIRAIDPRFRPEELARYGEEAAALVGAATEVGVLKEALGGVASGLAGPRPDAAVSLVPEAVAASVARPTPEHVRYAAALLMATPSAVRTAAASPFGAAAVLFALLLSPDESIRARQLAIVDEALGPTHGAPTRRLFEQVRTLGPEFRIPLVDLTLPALQRCERPMIARIREVIAKLVDADGRVEPFEYLLSRIVRGHLADALRPGGRPASRRPPAIGDCAEEARAVLSTVARFGNAREEDARRAYDAGMQRLLGSQWPEYAPASPGRSWSAALDASLARLDGVAMTGKRQLVEALAAAIGQDGRSTVEECELLRAICETLHCPLPPLAAPAAVPGGSGPAPA